MTELVVACWEILCKLSPWLLVGLLLSAVIHAFLPANFVRRRFQGMSGVLQAVAIGVPLPLCSCGVIPTGIGLKNEGADDGAAVGFLISTPQTGIDSILVSVSFFGWPFAIFKMFSAMILGLVGGWLTNLSAVSPNDKTELPVNHDCCNDYTDGQTSMLRKGLDHGLEIFAAIWFWLVVGIVVSALIEVAVPEQWIQKADSLGILGAMLLVLLVSVPLYVCATASVPMAAALVVSGFPPAAALVFLVAGPATNTSTMGAIYGRFGMRVLAIYLVVIVVGSLICGWLFDYLIVGTIAEGGSVSHEHGTWIDTLSALLVIGLIVYSFLAWCFARTSFSQVKTG